MRRYAWPFVYFLAACGGDPKPPPEPPHTVTAAAPPEPPHADACAITISDTDLRAKDSAKVLDQLVARIRLSPTDEALRVPKSLDDVKAILRRDTVYLFPAAAAYARSVGTKEGRFSEATTELLMGESQLTGAQVLYTQAAWVATDLRIARATLATEASPMTDRDRLLAQLIHLVDDGDSIAAALGNTAPGHIARGAEVIRAIEKESPNDSRTYALEAEYHRLRGEWGDFETAMQKAEATSEKDKTSLRYLRGMEQLERFHSPQAAATMMREALKAFPKFVRAQAALVLMAPNAKVAMAELAKLRAMNEDHYLVMLLQPTLAADQELAKMGASDAPN